MTTKVTVTASGPMYPAHVIHTRRHPQGPQEVLIDKRIPSGESLDVWCGTHDTITVTEEYHPEGYPLPVNETSAQSAD